MLNVQLGEERPEASHRSDARVSPISPSAMAIRSRQPEHASSPVSHKRRRLSPEDNYEHEHTGASVPQDDRWAQSSYASRSHSIQRPSSAAIPSQPDDRRASNWSDGSWVSSQSGRTAPYEAPGMLSRPRPMTPPFQGSQPQPEWQPSKFQLPSLQTLTQVATMPRPRSTFNEYALDSTRPSMPFQPQQQSRPAYDPMAAYYQQQAQVQTPYGYQQPRGVSYSGPSGYAVPHERTPFSAAMHHGYAQPGYYAMNDGEGETKQRKRRGNLPKETTDILRAWFVAHLHHPYPTEDEKQDLMRQTGLQMSMLTSLTLCFQGY